MIDIVDLSEEDTADASKLFDKVVSVLPFYSKEAKDGQIEIYSEENLRYKFKNPDRILILAKNEGKVVGFCFSYLDSGVCWIDWLGVDEEYRKAGLGQSLLKETEKRVKDRGGHKIWADTRTNNTMSIPLIEKLGYKKIADLKDYWYHLDFCLWEKSI